MNSTDAISLQIKLKLLQGHINKLDYFLKNMETAEDTDEPGLVIAEHSEYANHLLIKLHSHMQLFLNTTQIEHDPMEHKRKLEAALKEAQKKDDSFKPVLERVPIKSKVDSPK